MRWQGQACYGGDGGADCGRCLSTDTGGGFVKWAGVERSPASWGVGGRSRSCIVGRPVFRVSVSLATRAGNPIQAALARPVR